ncbi:MAG: hypothetical protein L6V83_01560 [Christensenella sp.]|nr:MAG: hypothetical protein L6V83_01560 [Christensenella sp.]
MPALQSKVGTITPGQANNSQDCLLFCPFESNEIFVKIELYELFAEYRSLWGE